MRYVVYIQKQTAAYAAQPGYAVEFAMRLALQNPGVQVKAMGWSSTDGAFTYELFKSLPIEKGGSP